VTGRLGNGADWVLAFFSVGAGYWNRPEATALGGLLRTREYDPCESRRAGSVCDRAMSIIHLGGESVYCAEAENALACVPEVLNAAVLAVPDEMMGERSPLYACHSPERPSMSREDKQESEDVFWCRVYPAAGLRPWCVPAFDGRRCGGHSSCASYPRRSAL
jgi:acyl-CoA synthetase (AMP-forming)/AMP-acid ligase II